jgi:non-specific protein-tyrosine kinase
VSEAVRNICASIVLSRSERPPKTLLVTSALPGEGKTTIANELGRAFADNGCRTLLVECDMRRPSFGRLLGVGSEGGLSLFLAGHIERPKFHQVIDDRLVVVAAGPTAPNPIALLHSEKMRAFLSEMTRTFQFVILDAPPVLPLADARMLGALSEGVVLVVRAGTTSRSDVRRACAALDGSSRLLGTILNGTHPTGREAAYYRQYLAHDEA